MYGDDGAPLFPFHWTANPKLIRGAIYETLSEFERDTVAYLESLNHMSPRELLDVDRAPAVLDKYLSKLPSELLCFFVWLVFYYFLLTRV
jgi:hypothetical protein